MIRLIQSAFLWPKLKKRYLEGDYPGAADIAARYRSEGIVDPVFEALEATLHLLTDKPTVALNEFWSVVEKLHESKRKRNKDYIENYCLYYIDLINGGDGEKYRKRALNAAATNFVKRSLPLSDG